MDKSGAAVRLTIHEHVASGYFGSVYRATDAQGKNHAVKFLKPEWLKRWNRETADFAAESEVLRAIKDLTPQLLGGYGEGHIETEQGPRVTGVHIDWAGDNMRVLGRTRDEPLAQRTPGKAVRIVREVLHGLVALHSKGYAHEDVGPGNIMIDAADSSGSVKVIDPANGRAFSGADQKQTLDVKRSAQLLVALLTGSPMDNNMEHVPRLDGLKGDGIDAHDLSTFQTGLRNVLQDAIDGKLSAAQLRDAIGPYANHGRFR